MLDEMISKFRHNELYWVVRELIKENKQLKEDVEKLKAQSEKSIIDKVQEKVTGKPVAKKAATKKTATKKES